MDTAAKEKLTQIWEDYEASGFQFVSHNDQLLRQEDSDAERHEHLPRRQKLLEDFLDGESDLESFKSDILGEAARNKLWGFSGISGGMFFNILMETAQYDDETDLSSLFQNVLSAPNDRDQAKQKIRDFEDAVGRINDQVDEGQTPPGPGHIPYFVSFFWQLQEPDTFPIYYKSMRVAMDSLELWKPSGDLAEDYVEFWDINEVIRTVLEHHTGDDIHLWTVERLFLYWLGKDKIQSNVEANTSGRIWQISPGHGGRYWNYWVENGIASIGYNPDKNVDNADELDEEEVLQEAASLRVDSGSRMAYRFREEIKEGDVIVAKRGTANPTDPDIIYGIGSVTNAFYRNDSSGIDHSNIIDVDWHETFGESGIDVSLPKGTHLKRYSLNTIEKDEFQKIIEALAEESDIDTEALLNLLDEEGPPPESPPAEINYYWITANPSIWRVNSIKDGGGIFYTAYNAKGNKRRIYESFQEAKPGDKVIFYESSPTRAVVAEGIITEELHEDEEEGFANPVEGITIEYERPISDISWSQLTNVKDLEEATPIRNGAQGSLFELTEDEFETILALEELGSDSRIGTREPLSPIPEEPREADKLERQITKAKQVVFHGPPGTGKTYTAIRFSRWWLDQQTEHPTEDQLEVVTFHPSFTYEDFIEGLTAEEHDGGVKYSIKDGVFKRLCKRAIEDFEGTGPTRPYMLVIDEINRGNLAQIFGEIITLLEPDKRLTGDNETVTILPHSKERFIVPPNVYIIGTMNTADRSIALVDAALRRRFRFISFPPESKVLYDEYGFSGAHAVEEAAKKSDDPVQQLLALSILGIESINKSIRESANLGKGKQIGHSYLINIDEGDSAEERLRSIAEAWEYEILPLLEEYFFSQFDRIQQDLFDGIGGRLFDWEHEEIKGFRADDLAETLIPLTGSSAVWMGTDAGLDDVVFTYQYLLEEGVLQNGDELVFNGAKVPSEATRAFEENDPFWLCEVTGETGQRDNVRWQENGETYSLTGLAITILEDISEHAGEVRGPDYWCHPQYEDKSLNTIREQLLTGDLRAPGTRPKEPTED